MSKERLKNNMLNRYGNEKVSQMNTNDMLDMEARAEANSMLSFKSFDAYKEQLSFVGKMYTSITDNVRSITSQEMIEINKAIEDFDSKLNDESLSPEDRRYYTDKKYDFISQKIQIAENDKALFVKIGVGFTFGFSALAGLAMYLNSDKTKEEAANELKDEN